ncbi:hypothetical protein [Amycolatopsis sp. cg9]|uniref:hypothetical protein n=1 Tax=Amycolatopsis sp. cg9 TaxID=3238801 RepID=UPI0035236024
MFGKDPRFEGTREAVRPKDPPVDVEADTTLILLPRRLDWGRTTPIWVRAFGVGGGWTLGRPVEQFLTVSGDWWCVVEMQLVSQNGRMNIDLRMPVDPAMHCETESGDEPQPD